MDPYQHNAHRDLAECAIVLILRVTAAGCHRCAGPESGLAAPATIVLRRQVPRPRFRAGERVAFVLLARLPRGWVSAMLIVQPATILRWHREMWRRFWSAKSRRPVRREPIPQQTNDLIASMASRNMLWGAERIRGELLKLGVRCSKRTIQKYMRRERPRTAPGPSWRTFLHEHARDIWVCDFLQTYDAMFRSVYFHQHRPHQGIDQRIPAEDRANRASATRAFSNDPCWAAFITCIDVQRRVRGTRT